MDGHQIAWAHFVRRMRDEVDAAVAGGDFAGAVRLAHTLPTDDPTQREMAINYVALAIRQAPR